MTADDTFQQVRVLSVETRDCIGEATDQTVEELDAGRALLLENLRFHPEEEANSSQASEAHQFRSGFQGPLAMRVFKSIFVRFICVFEVVDIKRIPTSAAYGLRQALTVHETPFVLCHRKARNRRVTERRRFSAQATIADS